jgi:hypothetical protein
MCRRACLTLALCLVAVPVCVAGIATNRYTISSDATGMPGDFLAAREGELTVGGSTFGAVADTRDAPDRWYVVGTKIKSSLGGYLAYDTSGKSNRVFLTPEMGEGTDWLIGRSRHEGERGTIQAAVGPLQGWFLCVEEAEGQRGTATDKAAARRVVLARDPARKLEAERIYEHK